MCQHSGSLIVEQQQHASLDFILYHGNFLWFDICISSVYYSSQKLIIFVFTALLSFNILALCISGLYDSTNYDSSE